MVPLQWEGLSAWINVIKVIPKKHVQSSTYQMILGFVKLILDTIHPQKQVFQLGLA